MLGNQNEGFSSAKRQQIETSCLFVFTFVIVFIQLLRFGSMTNISGDAADIWKTITTWYDNDTHPSYVLYKGFASVYPYVWLYQIAKFFKVNDYLFIMCYHALLFSYVTTVAIPVFVNKLTKYRPSLLQKVMVVIVLCWYWWRYRALTQLMVDLPSCAFFFMSIHTAILIENSSEQRRRSLFAIITGLLCGLYSNISGQYSIAAICILIYAMNLLWKGRRVNSLREKLKKCLPIWAAVIISWYGFKVLNVVFDKLVLGSYANIGIYIAKGEMWMERALIYMMDIPRLFYGPQLYDPRGHEIVMSLYGVEEGTRLLEMAAQGGFGWSIKEYFGAFIKHPVDFILMYLNRGIISISDDCNKNSLISLLFGYTLVFVSLKTLVNGVRKVQDIFTDKLWLVLGPIASMIPVFVMTVEMRYTIGFQAMWAGTAILGPVFPEAVKKIANIVRQYKEEKSLRFLAESDFPWGVIGYVLFCLFCLGYFGSICAGSGIGSYMLFRW